MHQTTATVDATPSRVRTSMTQTPFEVTAPHIITPADTSNHKQPSSIHGNNSSSFSTRPHFYNTKHSAKIHGACASIDPINSKSLEYRQLSKNPV